LLVAGLGLSIGWALFSIAMDWPAIESKLRGNSPGCAWGRVFSAYRDKADFLRLMSEAGAGISLSRIDDSSGFERLHSRDRAFWIKAGHDQAWSGRRLLGYLLGEHALVGQTHPQHMARHGDVVLDCGAHIGVFTHFALRRGASKVVAIEPDPANMECLRRNFASEISDGRVVPVAKGVWSTVGELALEESTGNSGGNSLVGRDGGLQVRIEVITIDRLIEDLRLSRVDCIKMDIEGAEREALQGAQRTLRKFRPRLMFDAYHRPDDPIVLPRLVRQAHRGYTSYCGPCEMEGNRLVPHALFFQP
jgi:FkbM family methyltransferase